MMDIDKLLRDLKVFMLVTLFYLALLAAICLARALRARGGGALGPALRAEFRALMAHKTFTLVFSAVYLFTAMYAVKNVGARILLMFIYLGCIVKLVKTDLESRQ